MFGQRTHFSFPSVVSLDLPCLPLTPVDSCGPPLSSFVFLGLHLFHAASRRHSVPLLQTHRFWPPPSVAVHVAGLQPQCEARNTANTPTSLTWSPTLLSPTLLEPDTKECSSPSESTNTITAKHPEGSRNLCLRPSHPPIPETQQREHAPSPRAEKTKSGATCEPHASEVVVHGCILRGRTERLVRTYNSNASSAAPQREMQRRCTTKHPPVFLPRLRAVVGSSNSRVTMDEVPRPDMRTMNTRSPEKSSSKAWVNREQSLKAVGSSLRFLHKIRMRARSALGRRQMDPHERNAIQNFAWMASPIGSAALRDEIAQWHASARTYMRRYEPTSAAALVPCLASDTLTWLRLVACTSVSAFTCHPLD